MRTILLSAALALCAACSPQPAAEAAPAVTKPAAVHPVSGLKIVPLTVTNGKKRHSFRVEVAASQMEQARGLMFRTQLGPDEGMIFPRDGYSQASFWMKNTPLSLDIIFVGTDGRISNIAANTVPYSLQSVSSEGMASLVLELRGGRAAELGIVAGDKVEW
ncbi:DUF192 domain-containing protein [Altererythrobacter confluentis]|uniref:DUF192 domain-containing protein n=1 Tax=Allopontixanthobacter confluentis TaxID=1849021 RepID=A0A6L7GCI4_9SPHN|nr:DUF192 domain-containing protein [Allopontixanthobacter confluentis]MXP13176.1 DUF192 domain-containing protein [Allopontixanthobacter confluentis]